MCRMDTSYQTSSLQEVWERQLQVKRYYEEILKWIQKAAPPVWELTELRSSKKLIPGKEEKGKKKVKNSFLLFWIKKQ